MASKQISAGVGIPMIIVGALMAFLWAPTNVEFFETIEFVGALIGILGVIFFVTGLMYAKEPVIS
jgi:flagellar biosynthesis protein FliQ